MGKTKLKGGFKSSRQISRLSKVSLSQYKRHSDQKHRKLSFSHDHGDLCCKPGNSDDLDDISPRLSWWQGRRVVELDVLAKALSRCTTCSAPLHLRNCVGEWKRGLGSFLYVRCSNCHKNIMVPTGKVSKQIFDMNKKLATATLHSGLGETQVNSFLATLNVPTVSHTMLDKRMKESGGVIHKVADSSLDKSLEEELLQTRDVGDTEITVSVDAGWQKRGSGRSYDSLSGHCSMIGAKTGKILDYTVRSKVCRVCQSAATKSSEPQQHLCSKNWTGSSKGMEPDMVSEMIVKTSAKDVKISTVIGDDDATTMARLRKNVKENILKRSDANHIKKTLGNMLYSLQRKHKSLTSKTIRYIQKNFNYMLAQNKQNPDGISRGLKAMSSHPFGCHSFCEPSWCRFLMAPSAKHKSLPYGKPLSDLSLREDIKGIFESFQIHKVKLSNLGSTQANESFNKTVASKAPKSKHYGGSSSLGFRVAAAVAQKNIGQTYVMNVNKKLGLSPGKYTKMFFTVKDLQHRKRKAIAVTHKAKLRRLQLKANRGTDQAINATREGVTYCTGIELHSSRSETQVESEITTIPPPLPLPDLRPLKIPDDGAEIFFDVETTGLSRSSHITQLSAVRGEDVFNCYVRPKIPITSSASAITGVMYTNGNMYHNGKAVSSVPIKEALTNFIGFLNQSTQNILIGHNIKSFDCHVLMNAVASCDMLEDFFENVFVFFDTLPLIKKVKPDLSSYSLPVLYRSTFNEEFEAHDALMDSQSLKRLYSSFKVADHLKSSCCVTAQSIYLTCKRSQATSLNLPSLGNLVSQKVLSVSMAKKIAASGLCFNHLKLAFRRSGSTGICNLFTESCRVKARVTKSSKIIHAVSSYFSQLSDSH